jgi:hypothetical protein
MKKIILSTVLMAIVVVGIKKNKQEESVNPETTENTY